MDFTAVVGFLAFACFSAPVAVLIWWCAPNHPQLRRLEGCMPLKGRYLVTGVGCLLTLFFWALALGLALLAMASHSQANWGK